MKVEVNFGHGTVEYYDIDGYTHLSTFAKIHGISPTRLYNTGRKPSDKRWVEMVADINGVTYRIIRKYAPRPEAKPETTTYTYEQLDDQAKMNGDNGYCGPIAVAIAAGVDFDTSVTTMAKHGRQFRKGCTLIQMKRALEDLGVDMKLDAMLTSQLRRRTINQASRYLTKGKYIVSMRGHVAAVVDGEVQDWTAGRRHQVQQIYKVA